MAAQVRWRPIREGHEKQDRAFNEALADKLLADPAVAHDPDAELGAVDQRTGCRRPSRCTHRLRADASSSRSQAAIRSRLTISLLLARPSRRVTARRPRNRPETGRPCVGVVGVLDGSSRVSGVPQRFPGARSGKQPSK
jgi:hypothetical protein